MFERQYYSVVHNISLEVIEISTHILNIWSSHGLPDSQFCHLYNKDNYHSRTPQNHCDN